MAPAGMSLPCQTSPDMWFSDDPRERAIAVHQCKHHCPQLARCAATERAPMDGVLAGVLYNTRCVRDKRQPPPVRCGGCLTTKPGRFQLARPAPGPDCGTSVGYARHRRHSERPCAPCAAYYNTQRSERKAAKAAAA